MRAAHARLLDGAADASGAGPDIDVEDEQAAKFVHAQARMPRIYAPSIYMGRIYAAPANFEIQIHIYGVWIPQFAGGAYILHIYGPHMPHHIYASPMSARAGAAAATAAVPDGGA